MTNSWITALLSDFYMTFDSDSTDYYLSDSEYGTTGIIVVATIALIIALAVVSSMKRKLNTAKKISNAQNYVKPHSLYLTVREDRFLYTTETRHRVAQQNGSHGPARGPMQKGR